MKFEQNIKSIFPDAEISVEKSNFSLRHKNLSLENTKEILKKIQKTAGDLAGESTALEIKKTEKNLIFVNRNHYKIDVDLLNISEIDDLELNLKIIHPNKANIKGTNTTNQEVSDNIIVWRLNPGQINTLEFSFWSWNKLLIGISFISLLIVITYFLKFFRFKLGTDLPQLPPD